MLPAWLMFHVQRSMFGQKRLQAHEMVERKDGNVRQVGVGAVHHLGLQLDIGQDTVHSVTVRSLVEVFCGSERSVAWWVEQEDDGNGLCGEKREVANALDCGVQLGVEKRGR